MTDYIEDKLTCIENKLDRILMLLEENRNSRYLSVKDIASICGISRQTLYTTKRYLIPNFGEGPRRKYTLAEVQTWLGRGEDELKEEWKNRNINKE